MSKKCILIAGMHRSGTSAVAGLLNALGVDFGKRIKGASKNNQRGFFENISVIKLNQKIIESNGGDWNNIVPLVWKDVVKKFEADALRIIADEFGDKELIAIKDPRFCLLAPFWAPILKKLQYDVVYIIPFRHPYSVGESLQKRDGMDVELAVKLWKLYNKSILEFTAKQNRILINYDNFIENTKQYIDKLAKQFDLSVSGEAKEFVTNSLRHHSSSTDDSYTDFYNTLCKMEKQMYNAAGQKDYRAFVGPPDKYDIMGAAQFNMLTKFGLREHHKILDIGCGSLRAGKLLIPYLLKGHYFGLEPNKWLIDDAIAEEIGEDLVRIKAPTFDFNEDFILENFGESFDYIMAQSIFTHAYKEQIEKCFDQAGKVLKYDGQFFFTAILSGQDYEEKVWRYPKCAKYTEGYLVKTARSYGFICKKLGDRHPNGHTWFVLTRA